MIVRKATRADLLGIGRVAESAHWASYEDLLRSDTIGQLVARDFSPSALARRLLRGGVFVATLEDEIVGFVDGHDESDRLHVSALATDPDLRRRGIGTALLTAIRQVADLPVAADVLLGHLEVEQFFETAGFVPGEVRQVALFGVDVIERRWWAEAQTGASGRSLDVG
jgi:ribosomal protein S18 acetylase RimI-like enzyme